MTSEVGYRNAIRASVRALWSGVFDYDNFWDGLSTAIKFYFPRAWHEGAIDCGIAPNELTSAEKSKLQQAINYEFQWIHGYATAIEENSQANGGKLSPLFSRAEIWIGRWEGVKSEARTMACGNKKLKWILGTTEKSCSSCLKLDGKVKRASYWEEKGILPRVHGASYLECKGFRCDCTLQVTDEPMSRGPLPKLP